ncbi:MAG: flavodoxin [Patescibacteria group bacterium]|nr:flavodoxin [Patescibacteria group bacterium]
MKILIIYFSFHHQNTKKLAFYLKEKLKASIIDLQTNSLSKIKKEIKKYSIIGFGSGIYFGKHHQLLFKLIDQIPKLNNKKAIIFSTAGLPSFKFFWHLSLRKKLKNKGFKIIGEFSLPGYDTFGFLKYFGGINKEKPTKNDLIEITDKVKQILK